MKTVRIACAAIAAAGLGLAALAGPAESAPDTTPPVWTKPPNIAIPLGTQLNPAILGDCDAWSMPVTVSWTARDPESAIDHYGYSPYDLGPEDETPLGLQNHMTWTYWVEDDTCGGGGADKNVYAWNGAGLHTSWYWSDQLLGVVQDDRLQGAACYSGADPTCNDPWNSTLDYIRYNGTWGTSACNCWSGGTTQKTTQSGASAVLRLPYDPFQDGKSYGIGLIMAKAPDRGKAAIFVDGVRVATVDTYAGSKVNRTVVWRQTVPVNTQTVKVVNLATSGRTRIDLDAFVLVQKQRGRLLTCPAC